MAKTLEELGAGRAEYTYADGSPRQVLHIEGRREIRIALDSTRFQGALNCLAGQLRQWDKYGMQDEKSVGAAVARIRKEFYSVLEEYHVDLDSYDEEDI